MNPARERDNLNIDAKSDQQWKNAFGYVSFAGLNITGKILEREIHNYVFRRRSPALASLCVIWVRSFFVLRKSPILKWRSWRSSLFCKCRCRKRARSPGAALREANVLAGFPLANGAKINTYLELIRASKYEEPIRKTNRRSIGCAKKILECARKNILAGRRRGEAHHRREKRQRSACARL